ncbi:ubiquinone/menaquinone biosynthesis methyltransferase [Maridesulfovibrio hydrothermalis]|uniref:Demethylmenaquinone methyltransferase n=1 Tax=Maridesulfovibrio hydrothermalis AM13 = DSM 14728 TaxID=1121451 RepID=L0R893_9BACT|nr:ubiquinone/menaquinone biosynthesis methyltransferase [Maridesulfovibrio hydrothermalis]CCO22432.1 Ubiquinone/menaquinone biosynthesis methyltransferase [Maridesulfovibrio hydrothermalis AM13 = DSM 14728]
MAQVSHEEHGKKVAAMFGRIAGWYDFLNHFLSGGQDIYWRYRLAKLVRPAKEGLVLDLAAGTLDVSVELTRQYPDVKVLAMDFAYPMLSCGKGKKLEGKHIGRSEVIAAIQADGKKLPLPDCCLDGATISFGIRNILPREDAYKEVLRALKPGARFCILEFGSGSKRIWKGVYNFYLNKVLPLMGKVVSGDSGAYSYLADTIRSFPDERTLGEELQNAGFGRVMFIPLLSGIVYIHVAEKPSE